MGQEITCFEVDLSKSSRSGATLPVLWIEVFFFSPVVTDAYNQVPSHAVCLYKNICHHQKKKVLIILQKEKKYYIKEKATVNL